MARGLIGPTPVGREGWVVAEGSDGVVAGAYATVLQPVAGGARTARGCAGWVADTRRGAREPVLNVNGRGTVTRTAAFAVSGRTLLLAGSPACSSSPPSGPRAVFAKTLPNGPWRVVMRTTARHELVLAAAGQWLAVGAPAGSAMVASVYDRHGRRMRYRVPGLLPGQLQLDSAGMLMNVATGEQPAFPVLDPGLVISARFRASWATPGSPTPQTLKATSSTAPILDRGHIALVTDQLDGTGQLIVKDVRNGRTRSIIGTRPPFRDIRALGLRGNTLAWLQRDDPVSAAGVCSYSSNPAAPAAHIGFNLESDTPFTAAPPAPATADCGIPPP